MLIDPIKTYTYNDYLTIDENERIEIIDGRISNMSPAPSRVHQHLVMKISYEIENYIRTNKGNCFVYPAPFDVILKNDDDEVENSKNIVQPNISVICDRNKLTDKGCTGSPDIYALHDKVKVNIYENFEIDFSTFNF